MNAISYAQAKNKPRRVYMPLKINHHFWCSFQIYPVCPDYWHVRKTNEPDVNGIFVTHRKQHPPKKKTRDSLALTVWYLSLFNFPTSHPVSYNDWTNRLVYNATLQKKKHNGHNIMEDREISFPLWSIINIKSTLIWMMNVLSLVIYASGSIVYFDKNTKSVCV